MAVQTAVLLDDSSSLGGPTDVRRARGIQPWLDSTYSGDVTGVTGGAGPGVRPHLWSVASSASAHDGGSSKACNECSLVRSIEQQVHEQPDTGAGPAMLSQPDQRP